MPSHAGPHFGSSAQEVVGNLALILQAGVTTFVCLQQELPSTATAASTNSRSTYGQQNVVTARPYIRDAQSIVDAGGMPSSGSAPLSFVHVPIAPGGPGVLDDAAAKALVLQLVGYQRAGEFVYLHCGDGNGRSGTIAAILLGLAFNLGPVEAMALMQKSRNDRAGTQGPAPETHEQRMQVHRLLSDRMFRQAAAAVTPQHPDTVTTETNAKLSGVLAKVRGIIAKKGASSFIYLKRYAAKVAGNGTSVIGNQVSGYLSKSQYEKLCSDAEWHLTPDESSTLWDAALSLTASAASNRSAPVSTAGAVQCPPGTVDVSSLFRVIRGQLPPRRAQAVHDAFARVAGTSTTASIGSGPGSTGYGSSTSQSNPPGGGNGNGSGAAVSLERLAAAFSAAQHPDVKANRRTEKEVGIQNLDICWFAIDNGAGRINHPFVLSPPSFESSPCVLPLVLHRR